MLLGMGGRGLIEIARHGHAKPKPAICNYLKLKCRSNIDICN